ncbi:uncharacterized protein LOC110024012 isoform X2 [Phalaenopsis equestris]|uniref:uncharacterized protein LOC110024012 isoform X2 n=1 Tax=Phalaenopsis equestris TaxID=78828 RepID=UPI0009E4734C|nr:uncharacterized protein LOC110024012 isoform X2 [Phalaenopsis equestris]
MSAVVCRKRSTSIFEEIQYINPSPSKKIRCSAGVASPPSSRNASQFLIPTIASGSAGDSSQILDHLRSLFPTMEQQYLEKVLEASGNNLDSAIMSLNDLCLESSANNSSGRVEENGKVLPEVSGEESANDYIPKQGSEWVDLFVKEMMNASDMGDARTRTSRALEALEKSIVKRVNVEATQNLNKESMVLKEQIETLLRENTILKSAVAIQHERQKDFEVKTQELHQLKQLASQYQEQLSKLEVNNYALAMHLKQAQQGYSIPGRFHPDIF